MTHTDQKPPRAAQAAAEPLLLPTGIKYGNSGKTHQADARTAQGRHLKTWVYAAAAVAVFLASAALEAAAI